MSNRSHLLILTALDHMLPHIQKWPPVVRISNWERTPLPFRSPWPPKSSRQWQRAAGVGARIALFEMHGHCLHAFQHAEPALHALKTDQTCAQGAVRQHGLRNQRRDAPAAPCPDFERASGPPFARSGAPRAAALVAPRSKTMTAQQLSASLGVLQRSVCELV